MQNLKDLQNRVVARIEECVAIINAEGAKRGLAPMKPIALDFNTKGTTAGWAKTMSWQISLNGQLLIENPDEMINETTGHEVAHLGSIYLFGMFQGRGHGDCWKWTMRLLGQSPTRTHDMMTAHLKQRKARATRYPARCKCKVHMVSGKTWNRMVYDHKVYTCNLCGTHVRPQQKVVKRLEVSIPNHVLQGSKMAICKYIYNNYKKLGIQRADMVDLFVEHAGCTKAGASTYYNTIAQK